jgi:hypothetical protein
MKSRIAAAFKMEMGCRKKDLRRMEQEHKVANW